MRLFLGVDGGQSGTTALIGDEAGRVLGAGSGGPCNHAEGAGGRPKILRGRGGSGAAGRAARAAGGGGGRPPKPPGAGGVPPSPRPAQKPVSTRAPCASRPPASV